MAGDTAAVIVSDRVGLRALRKVTDADRVVIETRNLKFDGLMPCALKYALWAVRPGGRIVVKDEGQSSPAAGAYEVPFNTVRQWIFKFLSRDVRLVAFDKAGSIELERVSPILPPGWSAGVVFSGRDAELPTLQECLRGLTSQPELSAERGGEIVVCGPPRDLSFLSPFPKVRYLEYVEPEGSRFLICRKKNELISALHGPRVVILHARVVLEPGALSKVPREFDVSSPNTVLIDKASAARTPYLSLGYAPTGWPGLMPVQSTLSLRHIPGGDSFDLHNRGPLFVDGGCFFVTKPVHDDCPLHPDIAWEEGEDVEWCARAFMHGHLIDMEMDCPAYSQTNKLRPPPPLGALLPYISRARWITQNWSNAAHYYSRRLLASYRR